MSSNLSYAPAALAIATMVLMTVPANAQTFTVPTTFGNGADIELTENGGPAGAATAGGNGTKVNMNARWNFANVPPDANPDRNEWAAMRFDLSEFPDKAMLGNVTLNVHMWRGNANNNKNLHFYALTPGITGDDWDESSTTYETMPGFTFDADSTTNILDVGGAIVDFGTFATTNVEAEGSLATITLPSLTTLVQGMGTNNLLTIMTTSEVSTNGQWRVLTKEGDSSEFLAISGNVGDFAPFLEFEMVEPGLLGDYNEDNSIDAADYVVWRKDPANFGGDPEGYNTWQANFGNSAPPGSGSLVAESVPEPTTLLLTAMNVIASLGFRRHLAFSGNES